MKNIFWISILYFLAVNFSFGQKYSLGTDYAVLLFYPEDRINYVGPYVLQYGIAATREISLKSSIVLGTNYHQTNIKNNDSVRTKSRYLEIPVYLKSDFSMFDAVFKGHMIVGTGFMMLLSEDRSIKQKNQNEWLKNKTKFKPEGVNIAWGLGFDVKLNKSIYLCFDGILKGYYLFRTEMNDSGDKLALIPMTKGGIFVWFN